MKLFQSTLLLLIAVFVISGCTTQQELTPEEAKQITKEAYIFAYPMLDHYKIMFGQALVEQSPFYEGPLNTIINKQELLDASFKAVVGANNNTLYTVAWLDLCTESLVLSVPPISKDRYFVFQFADMYTHNYAYICSRLTGNEGGKYLITGPNWKGEKPEGIKDVFTSEGDFVFMVGRIYIAGKDELDIVNAIQDQVELTSLDKFENREPTTAIEKVYPFYSDEKAKSIEFITYFNFLLNHVQVHQTEKELFDKFSKIGIGAGEQFNSDKLDSALADVMEEGVQEALKEIQAHTPNIGRQVNGWNNFGVAFGDREAMQGRYLDRATGAMVGIYGNSPEENSTYTVLNDAEGDSLDAFKYNYVLEFPAGQTPPVNGFWSITMYDSDSYMVENSINRFSVFGEDALLKYGKGNSLKLYFQFESPGKEKEGNWLPAPNATFALAMRIYWPKKEVLDGSWTPPVLIKMKK